MNWQRIKDFEKKSDSVFGKNLHNYYTFISWAKWYPDLLLDLMKPETGGLNLHLDQRIFLRCDVRFMSMYGTFSRGYGKCVSGDTMLFTDEGIKEIGEYFNYQNNDVETYYPTHARVVNRYGNLECSTLGLYNGRKNTIKLTDSKGYSVTATPNHRVLVMKLNGSVDFVKTEDIKIGDYLVINRKNNIWGNNNKVEYKNEIGAYVESLSQQSRSHLNIRAMPDGITPQLALIYGYLIGDGCMTSKNTIIFTNIGDEILDKFKNITQKYFNVDVKKRSGNNYDYEINDTYLRKYLEIIGFDYSRSYDKKVPKFIMAASKDVVSAFLQGLFDTDGTVDNKIISLTTVSEKLANQVHFLLLNFGIVSKLSIKKTKSKFGKAYQICISGNDVGIFKSEIGFGLKKKADKLDKLCNKKHNTNTDIIPYQNELVKSVLNELNLHWSVSREFNHIASGECDLTYSKLDRLITLLNEKGVANNTLNELYATHYFYSPVVNIEHTVSDTYDFHLPQTHSFVSNGIISHNTFDEVLAMVVVAMLFPNIELALSAQTKENAADLLKSKWNEIVKLYPLLKDEIREARFSKGNAYIEFKNDATIDAIANAQSTKGQRRRRLKIEESALLNNVLFQDALEPVVEVPRLTVGRLAIVDPMELNQQIHFFTTAGFRGSDEYQRSISMLDDMENLKGKIVLGSNWQLPCWYGRGSNKSKILSKKKNSSVVAFAQNYEQEWVGCADGALVNINKLMNCRTLTEAVLQNSDPEQEYYMGVDVARSQKTSNNQSSIAVVRVIRSKDKGRIIYIDVVNIINIPNVLNFNAQAAIIKKVQKLYMAKVVVLDANGLGVGLADELLKDTIDNSTGKDLGCWDTINDDNVPEVPNSPQILYNMKAQTWQNEIVSTFIDMVDSGKLRLLEKRQDNDFTDNEWDSFDEKVRPFIETDAFIEEAANLKMKHLNNGNITIEQVVKKVNKDRVSALIYVLWYVNKYAQDINNDEYDYCCLFN